MIIFILKENQNLLQEKILDEKKYYYFYQNKIKDNNDQNLLFSFNFNQYKKYKNDFEKNFIVKEKNI